MKHLTTVENTALDRGDLAALIEAFLRALDVAESSRRTYRRALSRFTGWISREGIRRPAREDILAYRRTLEEEGLSSFTVSCYLTAVRKLFEWTETAKIYPNVARGIKGGKRPRGFRKDPLTVDQARELLSGIDRATLEGKRNYALLNLLLRTGIRTIEAARADVGDIRQEGGEAVLWIQGKGRDTKDEFVLLTRATLSPVREYLEARKVQDPEAPLFASLSDRNQGGRLTTRSVSRIVKEHLREVGIDDRRITAHSLRHTAITLSLLGGATIQEARSLGRHASIDTTLIYAHNIERTSERAPERRIDALLTV